MSRERGERGRKENGREIMSAVKRKRRVSDKTRGRLEEEEHKMIGR